MEHSLETVSWMIPLSHITEQQECAECDIAVGSK